MRTCCTCGIEAFAAWTSGLDAAERQFNLFDLQCHAGKAVGCLWTRWINGRVGSHAQGCVVKVVRYHTIRMTTLGNSLNDLNPLKNPLQNLM